MVLAAELAQVLTFSGLIPSSVLGIWLFRASLWNFVRCRHPPNISDLELMSLLLSWFQLSRMKHLSLIHRVHEFLPKVFMQLMGLPCHKISTVISSRTSPLVTLSPSLKCCAKWLAKESDLIPFSTNFLTSWACWMAQRFLFHFVYSQCRISLCRL